jgi:hypothetical protein
MAGLGHASSENAEYHKGLSPNRKTSSAENRSQNLKLGAITCRNGRILTI